MADSPGKRAVANEPRNRLIGWVCAILLASPIDAIPFCPIDDIVYGVFGVAAWQELRRARRHKALVKECEDAMVRRMAGLRPRDERQAELLRQIEQDEQEEQLYGHP